jgi:glycerol-3-phosphate dehydrogenase
MKHLIPPDVLIISTSKGLSQNLELMSELIPAALGRSQPTAFLSGPSFAKVAIRCCFSLFKTMFPLSGIAAGLANWIYSRLKR